MIKLNKKAGIEMMESAITLFIIILILVFTIVMGYSFYSKYVQDQIRESQQEEAFKIARIISSLPEIGCSNANIIDQNCIDLGKMKVFENNKDYYFDVFGYANITLHVIYPTEKKQTISLYNNKLIQSNTAISNVMPIKIYNVTDDLQNKGSYYFGYIQVKKYYTE